MRFVKLNYRTGEIVVFCVDDITRLEGLSADDSVTIIRLRDGDSLPFQFPINDFCGRVFDIGIDTEDDYELIQIDEVGPDDHPITEADFSLNE